MSDPELDLDGMLRDHFSQAVDGVDGTEDWGDLTGRIRSRARRRVQIVSSAAAVAVIAGLGVGFAVGDLRSSSDDNGALVTASGLVESPATGSSDSGTSSGADSSAGVANLGPTDQVSPGIAADQPTPDQVASNPDGSDQAGTEAGSPVAPSSKSLMSSVASAPFRRTTSSGVTLSSWSCEDGSTTIDAATADTVGRVVVGPDGPPGASASTGGPPLAAVAIVEGAGRPSPLVVVGAWAPGANRLRVTFPDGSSDVSDATGAVTAFGTTGPTGAGSTIRVESLTGTSDRVIAEVTVTVLEPATAAALSTPGC